MMKPAAPLLDEDTFAAEALRVLRRLHEAGAILAVAEGMEKAVVLRETDTGPGARTAVVDSAVAQAMALKDWIAPGSTGRVTRYHITSAGRAALRRMLEEQGAAADGFAEDQTAFLGGPDAPHTIEDSIPKLVEVILAQKGRPGLRYLDRDGRPVPW